MELILHRTDFADRNRWLMVLKSLGEPVDFIRVGKRGHAIYRWAGLGRMPVKLRLRKIGQTELETV